MASTPRWAWAFLLFMSFFLGAQCDCGAPPVVANTVPVKETSGTTGQNVIYECDRSAGYYEIPDQSKTSTCQADGSWTPVSDICTRACGVPERLDYAEPKPEDLLPDIFLPNATVSYNCRPGYVRVPGTRNRITCLDTFKWSTPEVFCQRRSCGNPGDVENADMTADGGFVFGARVTYTCHEGYRSESRYLYRDCQADGKWSNTAPSCVAVICPVPQVSANVDYNPFKDEYTYLDAITFKCKGKLEINGTDSASCISTGQWSSSAPTCVAVECNDPYVANSRRESGFVGPYNWNSAISFKCNDGFVLNGSSSIHCNIDSQWVPSIPSCLTFCLNPPTITYALLEERFANLPHYLDGTTVEYRCIPGYERNAEKNTITCSGRSWSKYNEFCSRISCQEPSEIPNASKSAPDYLFGSRVTYKCLEGFAITTTKDYRECQANGQWTSVDIECKAVCRNPPTITYALLEERFANLPHYFDGTTVEYRCIPGYEHNSEKNTITCSGNIWSNYKEFCSRISCQEPSDIPNANKTAPDYLFGSRVTYQCLEGFSMNTTKNYRDCQANGQWTSAEMECKGKADDPRPNNGVTIGIVLGVIGAVAIFVGVVYVYLEQKKKGKHKLVAPSVQYSNCSP